MCGFCLANPSFISAENKQPSRVDILIFSPHPGDETLACAGVILKAVQDNKTIKVVFLANGEAFTSPCSAWFKKKPQERRNAAQKAARKLSLSPEDEIFLSFPDNGLLPLWEDMPETFNRAKKGYSRQNLLRDIEDILLKYKPRKIYMPHPLDTNKDHQATAYFINCALEELKNEAGAWFDDLEVSYYLIQGVFNPILEIPGFQPGDERGFRYSGREPRTLVRGGSTKLNSSVMFSQTANSRINIASFKRQKEDALNEYSTQLNTEKVKGSLENIVKEEEIFWNLPNDKDVYLNQLEEEWLGIAKNMRQYGFNVNFGPVVDVAEKIEDRGIHLVKRQRLYSQSPNNVIKLAGSVIGGLNKGGVIPVLKHFPGLGAARLDTHIQLPTLEKTKERLYNEDLAPFKILITKYPNIWVMVDHAIYPSLSDKPASLSYEIQANLLRKELGFTGIIIADELLNMQAILEFVYKEKIPEPFIGEIIVRSFQAGTDIALIYPPPEKAEGIISHIIQSVINAVRQGKLKEEEIDISVRRILKEKERVLGRPLLYLLKNMPIEEKICQKIAVDIYNDTKLLNKYNLCGIRPRAELDISVLQNQAKIPMFIFAQHEGGQVNDLLLKVSTRSAYVVGREFERLADKNARKDSIGLPRERAPQIHRTDRKEKQFKATGLALREGKYDKAISSLLGSMDKLIGLFSELRDKNRLSPPNPNYLTPLTVNSDNSFELKQFEQSPFVWLQSFEDEGSALYAYTIFKDIYQDWVKKRKAPGNGADEIVLSLISLKENIEKASGKKDDLSGIRILCLAAHPDDEDGEALAYFGKKFNCQTYILLATRGEGGENAINSCLYEELGALRTEEVEKSAEILGVKKVYYLGKKDFGYSIDPNEVFQNWGRQDTLEKLVYFFRLIKPHIIITKHNTLDVNNHGQHRALAVLAEEAFDLAGNPEIHPEMLKAGLSAWQPVKFYQRIKGKNTILDRNRVVTLNMQGLFASKKKTCQQLAKEALLQHKSQWYFSRSESNNEKEILYQLVKAKIPSSADRSFFDWIKADDLSTVVEQGAKNVSPSGLPGVNVVNNLRIGLLERNNNILFVALKTLGCNLKSLDSKYLMNGDLSQFDTIILGQGVYTFYKALDKANSRLLEFIKKGGNLIVFPQYSREQFAAPYPLTIAFKPGNNEDAPINILVSKHPLFNFPNQIDRPDFMGWVQDRGLFFADKYSDKYTELTECFSSKGNWIKGGYLITDYGNGSYIYTGYAWYLQLRGFNVGAYKNLSNMLAYPFAKKNSSRDKQEN